MKSDAEQALLRAKLNRSDTSISGFSRTPAKKKSKDDILTWDYWDESGKRVIAKKTIERFNKMVIPPAWAEVWLSPDVRGHLQATGKDAKGRLQYRYHDDWTAMKSVMKFDGLAGFARQIPKIRKRVEADLDLPYRKRSKMGLARVCATVVNLMDLVHIRVGSDEYARKNESYGLTTLKEGHFKTITGEKAEGFHDAHFFFEGKSGKTWDLIIEDDDLVDLIKASRKVGGKDKNQDLFRYDTLSGGDADLKAEHINQYIRDATSHDYTAKDFRTWAATWKTAARFARVIDADGDEWIDGLKENLALKKLSTGGEIAISTPKQRQKAMLAVIDTVAGDLRNTRTVCRSSYIHPTLLADWENEKFAEKWEAAGKNRKIAGLDRDESSTLYYLSDDA